MGLEVRRELVDPVGEQGDLHLGRSGVVRGTGVRLDDLGLVFAGGGHLVSSCETERRHRSGAAVSALDLRSPVKPTGVVRSRRTCGKDGNYSARKAASLSAP